MLSDIHSPQDIKNLTDKQVQALLPEIREAIIDAVAHCGGLGQQSGRGGIDRGAAPRV